MTQAPVLRRDLPPEIPDDVDDPSVEKARGVVTLPRWIDWSSDDPTYDLSDRWQRIRVYEQVLREGTADDVRHFIDVEVLLDLWDELILPPAVSRAWIAWLAQHRQVTVRDCRDRARERFNASQAVQVVALSALQERVAALVAGLPESAAFVLAGGAAMAAHDMLDRATRDLDYFAGPDDAAAVQRFADAFEDAAKAGGLEVRRTRQAETFVRFEVRDGEEDCEVDLGIDYRALESVPTRYGPALDVRELGADKVLAIFGRAEPRDFVDLAELTRRVPFDELLALASAKDPGLDLAVLDQFMERVQAMRPDALGLDAESYRALVEQVQRWRAHIRQLLARERGTGRPGPGHGA